MFRQIRSKLLAAFAVPMAILVAVAGLAISSSLSQAKTAKNEREAVLLVALGLAGALLGLVLVIRVSRAVSNPLSQLAEQAQHLATVSLPATVDAILDADASGGELPEVPKVGASNVQEVAAVANALEQLNQTAVELASGQAALRRNLSEAFVNLGRRNQNLVTRQLEYITEIELKEADPTSLEELFRLDHLATRMRRNAESLLILAGSGPARQWGASVPVMDVARAASAEVEDYKRLRLHHFDPAMVTGVVTTDLVHILAELVENALSFSPPGAPVDVYGRFLEGAYVIVIVDSGIGMSSEDLAIANKRLEGQGADGGVPGRYLGHFVAGRLAARHGIVISLQPSHSGGLVARVKVPAALLEETVADLSAGAEVRPTAPKSQGDAKNADSAPQVVPDRPSAVSDAVLGLAASLAASTSNDGRSDPHVEPATNGSAAHANDNQRRENGGPGHFGFASSPENDPKVDDGLGAIAGNGVTDLTVVWASKTGGTPEQASEEQQTSEETANSGPEVDGSGPEDALAGTGPAAPALEMPGPEMPGPEIAGPEVDDTEVVKPYDWALPVEPAATAQPEATAGGVNEETSASGPQDEDADATQEFVPGEPVLDGPVLEGQVPVGDVPVGDVPVGDIPAGDVPVGEAQVTGRDTPPGPAPKRAMNGHAADAALARADDILPGHSWDPVPIKGAVSVPPAVILAAANDEIPPNLSEGPIRTGTPDAPFITPPGLTAPLMGTPDLGASAPLAGPVRGLEGNHFRSEPGLADHSDIVNPEGTVETARETVAVPALAAAASRPPGAGSTAAARSWDVAASPGAPVGPIARPAAQARSTADALRRLTRRVPGASLPEEDNSLRRPTTTSTTRNPLGLSGALSQYLSVTVEGRAEKEQNGK